MSPTNPRAENHASRFCWNTVDVYYTFCHLDLGNSQVTSSINSLFYSFSNELRVFFFVLFILKAAQEMKDNFNLIHIFNTDTAYLAEVNLFHHFKQTVFKTNTPFPPPRSSSSSRMPVFSYSPSRETSPTVEAAEFAGNPSLSRPDTITGREPRGTLR